MEKLERNLFEKLERTSKAISNWKILKLRMELRKVFSVYTDDILIEELIVDT